MQLPELVWKIMGDGFPLLRVVGQFWLFGTGGQRGESWLVGEVFPPALAFVRRPTWSRPGVLQFHSAALGLVQMES